MLWKVTLAPPHSDFGFYRKQPDSGSPPDYPDPAPTPAGNFPPPDASASACSPGRQLKIPARARFHPPERSESLPAEPSSWAARYAPGQAGTAPDTCATHGEESAGRPAYLQPGYSDKSRHGTEPRETLRHPSPPRVQGLPNLIQPRALRCTHTPADRQSRDAPGRYERCPGHNANAPAPGAREN